MLIVVACGGTATSGSMLASYERVWPDGLAEDIAVWSDGKVDMHHGEYLERILISSRDVTRLQDALAAPIPIGSPDDSPRRTLTTADGEIIANPRPDDGTITELLDRLLSTHSLG
jgi:hypothetical protein